MSRRFFSLLLPIALLSAAAVCAADLPGAWRSWRYSRLIDSPHSGVLNYLNIGPELFAHSENHLADLRIVDDLGAEIAYDSRSAATPPLPRPLAATLRENSFVPGQFTQVVVDLGDHADFHNSIRLQTPESDFINWVEVAASDDARTWRIVKARAPISRFRKENLEGNQTIHYSENNARYLRLRISEPAQQFPVTAAEVFPSSSAGQEPLAATNSTPLTALLSPDTTSPPSRTQWTVDLGSDRIPVAQLDFTSDQPEFYRAVRISNSPDGKEWQVVAGGEIYRFKAGVKLEESLRVHFPELWGPRYWRVEILNGNDAPITSARMSLAMTRHFLLFHPQEHRIYRLLYGNARVSTPQYDFARTLHIGPNEVLYQPGFGLEELTANYADPRPFTERHPALLWIALGIAVLLLAYSALRALRAPPAPLS